MSRRDEANAVVKPAGGKQLDLAPGHVWHEREGVGRTGITIEPAPEGKVRRKLTFAPTVGRVQALPEHAVFTALDAGDMDDVSDENYALSAWITLGDDGEYRDARGTAYAVLSPEAVEARAQEQEQEPVED